MVKKIGYARVSTRRQLENNSLDIQEAELLEEGCSKVYKEQFSAKTTDRPVFQEVLSMLEPGDCLVVCKLDRFSRTTLEGMQLMQDLLKRNIAVKILNFGGVEGGFNSKNKLFFQIMMAFAEYERDMIVERCQSGKEWSKQDPNFKDGRPKKFTKEQLDLALSMLNCNGGDKSYKEVERLMGISKSTLINEVKRRKRRKVQSNE